MYRFSWEQDSNRWDDAEFLGADPVYEGDDDLDDIEVDDSLDLDEEWGD